VPRERLTRGFPLAGRAGVAGQAPYPLGPNDL